MGGRGKQSDGGTFHASALRHLIEENKFNIPKPEKLPHCNIVAPYVLVADEAYSLKNYLLRPFPRSTLNVQRRVFNRRLSTARQTIECAYGILSTKWRRLQKSIETSRDNACLIIKTTCLLHNIILDLDGDADPDCHTWATAEINHNNMQNVIRNSDRNPTRQAKIIRDKFMNYFCEHDFYFPV